VPTRATGSPPQRRPRADAGDEYAAEQLGLRRRQQARAEAAERGVESAFDYATDSFDSGGGSGGDVSADW